MLEYFGEGLDVTSFDQDIHCFIPNVPRHIHQRKDTVRGVNSNVYTLSSKYLQIVIIIIRIYYFYTKETAVYSETALT